MTSSVQILPRHAKASRPPHVVFVAISPIQALDLVGPFEVFSRVARLGLARGYRLSVVHTGAVHASCGLSFGPSTHYRRLEGSPDTLLVAGGEGAERGEFSADLLRWIARTARRSRRVGSICTGAYVLGAAGVLDGRRAVTHWAFCRDLAQRYTKVSVEMEPIYIRDGKVYTSAGITAGIDLALALVEEDYGATVSRRIAKDLVLYLRRSGDQAQFSNVLAMQASDRQPIAELVAWINDHLHEAVSVDRMAAHLAISPRHFARIVVKETGHPPGKLLELLRVEAAKRMLETSNIPVKQISSSCGFGNSSSLRRAFARWLHLSPQDYRQRFHRSAGAAPP
jgi:transcriptional regulator GlxA family with amidase domain